MKRKLQCLFLAVIGGVVLFWVIWLDRSGKRQDNYRHPATPKVVSSEGISVQSKENVKQERIKNAAKITVKDGKKDRTLYWEEVDLNNVGVCADYLSSGIPFASNYSQISGGHYYYLRHELGKQYTYIIYQDEGKIIGKFNVEGDMEVFLNIRMIILCLIMMERINSAGLIQKKKSMQYRVSIHGIVVRFRL